MDLKIKICGLLCTIVLTINFIHGRDIPNVKKPLGFNNNNRETQKHVKIDPRSKHHLRHWTLRPWGLKLSDSQATKTQQNMKFDPRSQDYFKIGTMRPMSLKNNNSEATETQQQLNLDPQSQNISTDTPQQLKLKRFFPTSRPWGLPLPHFPSENWWAKLQQLKFKPKRPPRHPSRPRFPKLPGLPRRPSWDPDMDSGSVPEDWLKLSMNQAEQGGFPSPRMYKFEAAAPSQVDSPYANTFTAEWSYGIVPYYIDEETNDDNLKRRIQKAMSVVEASSCVIFKEKTEKPEDSETTSWLHFTNPNQQRECSHDAIEGENNDIIIVLGIDCLKPRDILHSVLHGLGFKDEVSHPHRDKYIRILWENVQPKYRPLFRVRREKALYKLVEYDPMSIMHFHDRDFSENGGLTIAPVMPGLVIEPSDNLSQLDVMQLRIKFGHECNKRKVGNLIDNCKNVLYHAEGNDDPESNAEGNDDQELKAEANDDPESNAEGNDDQELKAEEKDDQEVTAEGNDEQELKAEENDDKDVNAAGNDDQKLDAEVSDDQELNSAGNGTQKIDAEANGDQETAGNKDQKLDAEPSDDQELNSAGNGTQKLKAEINDDQELNAAGNKDQKLNAEASDDQESNSAGNDNQKLKAEVSDDDNQPKGGDDNQEKKDTLRWG